MKQNKQKQKHDTCKIRIQQDFVIMNKQKQNKAMTRNVPKTNVEQTKNNEELYLYIYLLGIQFKKVFF